MDKFIIFGGSGFISIYFVGELRKQGITDVTIAKIVKFRKSALVSDTRFVRCDVQENTGRFGA